MLKEVLQNHAEESQESEQEDSVKKINVSRPNPQESQKSSAFAMSKISVHNVYF